MSCITVKHVDDFYLRFLFDDMESINITPCVLIFLISVALLFDFMNGFHDAANSIATVVSTGVLKPHKAVIFAAFCNIIAYFVFKLKVAATIGHDIIDHNIVDHYVIFGALTGAIVWSIITWIYGLPSSSSHALIGGFVGSALAKSSIQALHFPGIFKVIIFIFLSPLLGFFLGILLTGCVYRFFFHAQPKYVDKLFRKLQLLSAGLYSIGHGGNDAQKTIGVIWMLLIADGRLSSLKNTPPSWVIWSCYLAIGLGTLMGGWRIVRTMGQKITKLRPVGGFCAETGGAFSLFLASILGIPVSTTHTITGAIIGVGMTNNISAVRWGLAGRIVLAWIFTIPASAVISAFSWWIATWVL